MSHYQALIADDDQDSAALLKRQVRDVLGLDAECVPTRKEMLCRANGHELLFVDLKLEGTVDDTIRELRQLCELYPVLVVTAQSDPQVLSEVANLGLFLLEKGEFKDTTLLFGSMLAKRLLEKRRETAKYREALEKLDAQLGQPVG